MNEYPSFFPTGVPPESSMDAHGTAFRLVNNDPPTSSDFRAYHLEKKIQSQHPRHLTVAHQCLGGWKMLKTSEK